MKTLAITGVLLLAACTPAPGETITVEAPTECLRAVQMSDEMFDSLIDALESVEDYAVADLAGNHAGKKAALSKATEAAKSFDADSWREAAKACRAHFGDFDVAMGVSA